MKSEELYSILKEEKYTFFSGVPCSYFNSLYSYILEDKSMFYVTAANEGLATSIAAGATLSGRKSGVIMQNSGLGNAINPITSLCVNYEIPLLFLISGRGYGGIKDEPQHMTMGGAMHKILTSCSLQSFDLSDKMEESYRIFRSAQSFNLQKKKPFGLIIRKDILEKEKEYYKIDTPILQPGFLFEENTSSFIDRYSAIAAIIKNIESNTALISTTGTISREIFSIEDRKGNFYMQGSMGHAVGIGLGVSLSTKKKVVVIDGDGALIMHMGILSTIGRYQPKNLVHIVLDNESYESTGSQPTSSNTTNFAKIAHACNYRNSFYVDQEKSLEEALRSSLLEDGPSLIHTKIDNSSKKPPRITEAISQPELAERFSNFLYGTK